MKIEDFKKQFEEIERKINAGETVQINLSEDGESIRLEVDSSGAEEISNQVTPEDAALENLEAMDDDSTTGKYNFDLSASDISDSEIARIIKQVPMFESSSDLPNVILARPDNKNWILHEECSYLTDLGYKLTALKGYETDLASIPRVFWTLVSSFDLSLAAPLFHDLLYRHGGVLPGSQVNPNDGKNFQRKEADKIFLEIMKKAEVPKWKREVAYYAVRSFASFAWKD